jgi:uncharacterized protein (TIGR03546 family)
MLFFSIKLLNNVRKAIAGRRYPHQLAGGVALGVLLGIIPHGNLLALFVLCAVLCFRVNHAMLAVVAIAVSFAATRLDPYSHQVGEFCLTHPVGYELAASAWELPLVPWMNINNTVVLGSFLIGLGSSPVIFVFTLPLFRAIAPSKREEAATEADPQTSVRERSSNQADQAASAAGSITSGDFAVPVGHPHSVLVFDPQHGELPAPRQANPPQLDPQSTIAEASTTSEASSTGQTAIPVDSVLASESDFRPTELPDHEEIRAVETQIDVIRLKDFREDADDGTQTAAASNNTDAANSNDPNMDEALNYLLRQLRHSQQRKAAG